MSGHRHEAGLDIQQIQPFLRVKYVPAQYDATDVKWLGSFWSEHRKPNQPAPVGRREFDIFDLCLVAGLNQRPQLGNRNGFTFLGLGIFDQEARLVRCWIRSDSRRNDAELVSVRFVSSPQKLIGNLDVPARLRESLWLPTNADVIGVFIRSGKFQ